MTDFLKYRYLCALLSLVIFTGTIGVYFYKLNTQGHAFSYSVDFTGGTQVILRFDEEVSAETLKEILSQRGWEGAVTREFSGNNDVLVRVKEFTNDATGLAERMRSAVQESLPGNKVFIDGSESVGPGIGQELRWKSFRAVLIALIAMLLYIASRFWSLGFALGAVVALFHDAIVMLAVFLIFDIDISVNVIGAILAVLGYSINDTIVIFSRIKENLKELTGTSLYNVVNISIGQTFKRTILTSISTGLTVGAMFILGGQALRDFSLALLVGIIFGTFSSIYIASPVMMLLYRKRKES